MLILFIIFLFRSYYHLTYVVFELVLAVTPDESDGAVEIRIKLIILYLIIVIIEIMEPLFLLLNYFVIAAQAD